MNQIAEGLLANLSESHTVKWSRHCCVRLVCLPRGRLLRGTSSLVYSLETFILFPICNGLRCLSNLICFRLIYWLLFTHVYIMPYGLVYIAWWRQWFIDEWNVYSDWRMTVCQAKFIKHRPPSATGGMRDEWFIIKMNKQCKLCIILRYLSVVKGLLPLFPLRAALNGDSPPWLEEEIIFYELLVFAGLFCHVKDCLCYS